MLVERAKEKHILLCASSVEHPQRKTSDKFNTVKQKPTRELPVMPLSNSALRRAPCAPRLARTRSLSPWWSLWPLARKDDTCTTDGEAGVRAWGIDMCSSPVVNARPESTTASGLSPRVGGAWLRTSQTINGHALLLGTRKESGQATLPLSSCARSRPPVSRWPTVPGPSSGSARGRTPW